MHGHFNTTTSSLMLRIAKMEKSHEKQMKELHEHFNNSTTYLTRKLEDKEITHKAEVEVFQSVMYQPIITIWKIRLLLVRQRHICLHGNKDGKIHHRLGYKN